VLDDVGRHDGVVVPTTRSSLSGAMLMCSTLESFFIHDTILPEATDQGLTLVPLFSST